MSRIVELWEKIGPAGQTGFAIVVMGLGYVIFRIFTIRYLERLTTKTTNDLDDRLIIFVKKFLWIVALFIAVVVVLRINNVEISPLLAGAGIFGVALGFAAKETIADVLSGVFLIADRPVRVGDRVKIESIGRHWGAWGDVVDIGLRRTRIRNTDGVTVNYP
ncbi:MAG: mechanosensitive ion channel family protein, partial [Planctomycetota bacterium]